VSAARRILLPLLLTATAITISARENAMHREDFQVIELRRYTIKEGEREHFLRYFESYFPESFQQLGAIALGQFREREHPQIFTWLRGFRTLDARAVVNASFYYGPLWKEHRTRMNDLLLDSDDVLLLTPLTPDRGVVVLPAVDVVNESAGGVAVAQIFAVQKESVQAFAKQAEATFAGYRAAGAREAGVLVTLDVPNNFPQLPIRTDGPYMVWLGILKDDSMLDGRFRALADDGSRSLLASGLLRSAPELVVLDPLPAPDCAGWPSSAQEPIRDRAKKLPRRWKRGGPRQTNPGKEKRS